MELTKEQYDIIHSSGNIKVNAVAGAGKTTTLIEYARTRPATSKILYIAFNKSVKTEATRKFAEKGIKNVKVETAHSLAYRYIVAKSNYKIRQNGYKTHEIAQLLNLESKGEKHAEYIVANHINKFIAYFCNSDKQRIQDLNYREVVSDAKARAFVETFYTYIESQVRILLGKMDKAEIEITHDFYLKKFQLSNPRLHYDYILFDEGQDASATMLDVFFNQAATKVIVGDTHQQIYGWRHAVNSLEKADFPTFTLSTSFRFGHDIAHLAMGVLDWKKSIGNEADVKITGRGEPQKIRTKAVIARTNLGLLLKAIDYVVERKKIKKIYFEGNIHSYTYADEGASLYDVLNLYNNKHRLIKDKLIKEMKNIGELAVFIEKTEDVQLAMMLEIVKEYGNKIPGIIASIKEKHIGNDAKEDAEMIFSTVHRCKGMEYDAIQIAEDFITAKAVDKSAPEAKKDALKLAKINEEINLLYVAITRTKKSIHIPESLMPDHVTPSPNIHIMRTVAEVTKPAQNIPDPACVPAKTSDKAYSIEEVRTRHEEAYKKWSPELDEELTVMYCEGVSIRDMAKHFGRTKGAISSRIKKLELEEIYG